MEPQPSSHCGTSPRCLQGSGTNSVLGRRVLSEGGLFRNILPVLPFPSHSGRKSISPQRGHGDLRIQKTAHTVQGSVLGAAKVPVLTVPIEGVARKVLPRVSPPGTGTPESF